LRLTGLDGSVENANMDEGRTSAQAIAELDPVALEQKAEILRDMTLDLICHLRNMPHSEGEPRQNLDGLAVRLREAQRPEDVKAIAEQLQTVCQNLSSITDTLLEKAIRARQNDLKGIIAAITASMKAISATNENLGDKLDKEIDHIEQALDEPDPKLASEKLLDVSQSLRAATTQVKADIEAAKSEVRGASGRIKELEEQLEQTRQESLRDGLTRLYNRRAFSEMLQKTFAKEGCKHPCSLIMLDIDHFKQVNDLHGHLIGDALLVKVARTVDGLTDPVSFAARYGGEEFAIIVGNALLTRAKEVAEELRARVSAARWGYRRGDEQRTLSATISLGVAQFRPNDTPESLVERADKALYLAKNSGRNQVRTELDLG
jgi:diguanylate cyclase